jgi:CRP-like cAMP-binding protein
MNAILEAPDPTAQRRAEIQMPWPALLGSLASADAQALDGIAHVRVVGEGRTLFTRGQAAHELVALIDGQAACGWMQPPRGFVTGSNTKPDFRSTQSDGFHMCADRVLHGPAWLSLASAFGDGQHVCDAVAQTPLQLAELPIEPLRALLARRPMLALRFVDTLAREVNRLDGRVHALMHKDAAARLAAWICGQFDGRPQAVLRLAERKRDIASQLGMTPETLSRLMRSLSDRGFIAVSGYTLRVLDAQALQGMAGS